MRYGPALLLASLPAACGDPDAGRKEALAGAAEAADRIECAVDGSATFERVCIIDRITSADGLTLTVHSPSGGFRRLLVTRDGRGVVAADGSEPAIVTILSDNRIEISLAGDRYRLPATVKK